MQSCETKPTVRFVDAFTQLQEFFILKWKIWHHFVTLTSFQTVLDTYKYNYLKNVLAAIFHVITNELNKSGQIGEQITQNDFCGQINCKNETEKCDTGPQNQS